MSTATVKSIANFHRITLLDPFRVSDWRRRTLLTCQTWGVKMARCLLVSATVERRSSQEHGKQLNAVACLNRGAGEAGCVCSLVFYTSD